MDIDIIGKLNNWLEVGLRFKVLLINRSNGKCCVVEVKHNWERSSTCANYGSDETQTQKLLISWGKHNK